MGVQERTLPQPVQALAPKPATPSPNSAASASPAVPKAAPAKPRPNAATAGSVKCPETFTGHPQFTEALRGGGLEHGLNMEVETSLIKALQNSQGFVQNGYHRVVSVCPKGSKIHGPRGSREIDPNGLNILQSDESVGPDKAAAKALNAIYIGLGMAGTATGGLLLGYLAADIWFRNRLINPYGAYGGYGGFCGYGGY